MAFIKSALEIALEKTQDIRGDKGAVVAQESRDAGKKLAGAFFVDPSLDLEAKFKEFPADRQAMVKEGFFHAVLTNLALPKDAKDAERLEPVFKALEHACRDKGRLKLLKQQLGQIFKQFIEDRERLADAIAKQLLPMLKQKEEKMSRQYGRPVRIDPLADPEYVKAYNANMANLEEHYGQALDQARVEIGRLTGLKVD
jgi:hypothetical protein